MEISNANIRLLISMKCIASHKVCFSHRFIIKKSHYRISYASKMIAKFQTTILYVILRITID